MQGIKYNKIHKKKYIFVQKDSNSLVCSGGFGLKVQLAGVVTEKQLEAARRVLTRKTKRVGKV